jgi:hypothetical protein
MSTFLSNSVSSLLNRVRVTGITERSPTATTDPPTRLGDFEQALKTTIEKPVHAGAPENTSLNAASTGLEPSYARLTGPNLIPIESLLVRETKSDASALSPDMICRSYHSNVPSNVPQPKNVKFDPTPVTAPPPSVKTPTVDNSARYSMLIPEPTQINPNRQLEEIIATASRFYGIEPNLSLAIAKTESSLNPKAVSSDGFYSKGLFQLLDETGRYMADQVGMNDKYDPYDPAQNSYLGISYLKRLHHLFSEDTTLAGSLSTYAANTPNDLEKLSIAAFNAGEGNVARAQTQAKDRGRDPGNFDAIEPFLPTSTRSYVKKVRSYQAELNSDRATG